MIAVLLKRLRASRSGAIAVEFGLLAPMLLTMMLGVFQIGMGMQNYNALRAVSAEMARYTVVNYQTGNQLDNSLIRMRGRAIATRSPYNLKDSRVEIIVSNAPARLAGTSEKTIELGYRIPTFLSIMGMKDIEISYNRSIVLPVPTP